MSTTGPAPAPKAGSYLESAFGGFPAVIVIRHGETEWSRSGRHTGSTDLPLTEAGCEQARYAGGIVRTLLGGRPVGAVISSPRQRALKTAELAGFAVTEVSADAREWDYGAYEGLTSPQIRERDPDWRIWDGATPGGETAEDVRARVDRLLAAVQQMAANGSVLIFSHGHASRCIAARWLGEPIQSGRHYRLGTGAVCGLDFEHAAPVILHWNLDQSIDRASTRS